MCIRDSRLHAELRRPQLFLVSLRVQTLEAPINTLVQTFTCPRLPRHTEHPGICSNRSKRILSLSLGPCISGISPPANTEAPPRRRSANSWGAGINPKCVVGEVGSRIMVSLVQRSPVFPGSCKVIGPKYGRLILYASMFYVSWPSFPTSIVADNQ